MNRTIFQKLHRWSISKLHLFVILAWAAGEFSVLHHPSGMAFRSHDHLRASTLTEVYTAAFGFSTEHFSNWQGIYIDAPFDLAQAVVTVSVDGVSDIGLQKGHHFPLKTDLTERKIYQAVANRILMHYPEEHAKLVRIDFSNGIEDVSNRYLNNKIFWVIV